MSGSDKSKTVNEKLKDFEDILDDYVNKTGLQHILYDNNVEEILKYTNDQLRAIDSEECSIAAACVSRYVIVLQKEVNRQAVRVKWANKELSLIVAKHADKHGDSYTKYEHKTNCVINDNSAAKDLWIIIKHAEGRLIELESQCMNLSMFAKKLEVLATSKKSSEWAKRKGE